MPGYTSLIVSDQYRCFGTYYKNGISSRPEDGGAVVRCCIEKASQARRNIRSRNCRRSAGANIVKCGIKGTRTTSPSRKSTNTAIVGQPRTKDCACDLSFQEPKANSIDRHQEGERHEEVLENTPHGWRTGDERETVVSCITSERENTYFLYSLNLKRLMRAKKARFDVIDRNNMVAKEMAV